MAATILIVSFSDLARDPRVSKQVRFLADEYELVCVGTGAPDPAAGRFIQLSPLSQHWNRVSKYGLAALLAARQHRAFYLADPAVRAARRDLAGVRADLILANDLDTLPLAIEHPGSPPVLYDAHEYAPGQGSDRFFRTFVRPFKAALLRRYLPRVEAMMTVSPGLAERYAREFGVDSELVLNLPAHAPELEPSAVSWPLRLVHHGGALPGRQLERMVDVVRALGARFELHFLLTPADPAYRAWLQDYAARDANVFFHEPVPMADLPRALNAYDMEIFLLEPNTFNHERCLPNKFFEAVQGRLALAIGPSVDMAELVREHRMGVIASDFQVRSMVRRLERLTLEEVEQHKRNAHDAAERYSDGVVAAQLRALVRSILA